MHLSRPCPRCDLNWGHLGLHPIKLPSHVHGITCPTCCNALSSSHHRPALCRKGDEVATLQLLTWTGSQRLAGGRPLARQFLLHLPWAHLNLHCTLVDLYPIFPPMELKMAYMLLCLPTSSPSSSQGG